MFRKRQGDHIMNTQRRRSTQLPPRAAARRTWLRRTAGSLAAGLLVLGLAEITPAAVQSTSFTEQILAPVGPESPLELRLFSTPAKTDSRHRVITGQTSDPVKNFIGAEAAGTRAGVARFTKIMFGAQY